jgi:formiminotetrahydrofolate cyclodeaminase
MLDRSVHDFLAEVAAPTATLTSGSVCAVTAAAAAGLAAMCARLSNADPLRERASEAEALRRQSMELAEADSAAYGAVLRAQRRDGNDPGRTAALRDALVAAAQPPRRLAAVAADIAAVAAELAARGKPALRGDAISAAELAAAAARSAAVLVRLNLSGAGLPPDRAVDEDAAAARRSADAALASASPRHA